MGGGLIRSSMKPACYGPGHVRTQLVVDVADLKLSADPNTELITYSLGSCIGVAIWDYEADVGGLLHFMLPDSSIDPAKARSNPAMFADKGIPLLFRSAYELGAVKKRLIVKIAGGAALFNTNETMDIGKRNYIMLRKIFWRNNVKIDGSHVGGSFARTMRLDVGTGCITVENRKMGRTEI